MTKSELIESISGVRPRGFRAPAFSLNRRTVWAFEILTELGFAYDSSLYDSPRIPCPHCGEGIKELAIRCFRCRRWLPFRWYRRDWIES